ncbi:MAG TPA: hypothetical protein PLA68_14295, partial [Panacibacter sp.]|nr:hypothetical protein [Panacibacter sp.]
IFSCICLIAYFFQKQLQAGRFSAKASLYILFAFILLFALRNFMAFLLVPALLTWYLCEKYSNRKPAIVFAVYGISLLLFFVSPYISNINFPDYVVEKQSEFKQIPGNSIIPVPALEPDAVSFLKFLPAAFDIAFLRPHISEVNNLAYIPAIGEIFLLWLLMALFLFRRGNTTIISSQSAFIIFCVSFSFSFLLLAGYTITFSGAIVRYRAVVLPLLFMPLAIWKFRKKYIVWGAAQ